MMTQDAQDLQLSSYDYDLPAELIAQRPMDQRDQSKLLVYNQKIDTITHTTFENILEFLPEETPFVFNQSKVFPCRLLGNKKTGARVEVFVLSLDAIEGCYQCLVKSSGKKKIGDQYLFEDGLKAQVERLDEGKFWLRFECEDLRSYLNEKGLIPIPPYIRKGESDLRDRSDYQTVFAKNIGSVAAPTAGLHFTPELLRKIKNKGEVTLHVGLGTFAPVSEDDLTNHKMHSESFFVDEKNQNYIQENWGKLFAVGTTALRTLESCKDLEGKCSFPEMPTQTDIFLYPGKKIDSIAGLVTNFHLPKSTLLMLVSSLIGRKKTLELYQNAIENNYRFFSYGDAMLILRNKDV